MFTLCQLISEMMEGIQDGIRFILYLKRTYHQMCIFGQVCSGKAASDTYSSRVVLQIEREQKEGRLALNEGVLKFFQEEAKFDLVVNRTLKSKRLERKEYLSKG
jgi:hypothetical protein